MSADFAKKLLQKYGWKEGEALGKKKRNRTDEDDNEEENNNNNNNNDNDNIPQHRNTYIRVVRRDPKCLGGLGHESDPYAFLHGSLNDIKSKNGKNNINNNKSIITSELDAVYGEIHSTTRGSRRRRPRNNNSNDSEDDDSSTDAPKRNHNLSSSSSSTPSEEDSNSEPPTREKKSVKENQRRPDDKDSDTDSSSSSSSENNNNKNNNNNSVLTDEELFKRCGGVRLGRAGRHRFFDGKLSRVEKTNVKETKK